MLLLVIAMLVYQRLPFRTESGEAIPEKSIAVLPFANFSEEKANAFFADGNSVTAPREICTRSQRHWGLQIYLKVASGGKEIGWW